MVAQVPDPTSSFVPDRGPWVATVTGGMWSIFSPRESDVQMTDIAFGLSRICRYGGQIRADCEFFSVAEHSTLMTEWMLRHGLIRTREDALKVLLHDGTEAILGDMITPLKQVLPEFRKIEAATDAVLRSAFGTGLSTLSDQALKTVDVRIRMDESQALIEEPALSEKAHEAWRAFPGHEPLGVEIRGLLPRPACREYLEAFLSCLDLPSDHPENDDRLERFATEARSVLAQMSPGMALEP